MNEINVGRFSGLLHKLLDMKEGSPAPTLAPEVVPVIRIDADWPEWAFLKNQRLAMAYSQQAAQAGKLSQSILSNPSGSGILISRIRAVLSETQGLTYSVYVRVVASVPAFDASANGIWVDGRAGFVFAAGVVGELGSAGATGTAVSIHRVLTNTCHTIDVPIVLSPGTSAVLTQGTANLAFIVGWEWWERAMEPAETR